MEVEAITEFLGVEESPEGVIEPDRYKHFYYNSDRLKYWIILDLEDKLFSISADFTDPFGGCSLFEIAVPWDRISIETEPKYYGDQKILVCRKNIVKNENHKILMLMKWPNGELSVWPNCAELS